MTPSQLRSFLAVADAGSVVRAAEALYVSQPAVSAALASLQAELGVALVVREGRGLVVSPAGELLASYARRLLGLFEEAAIATQALADPRRGQLRLAAVTTAGEHVVPALLASFRARHPEAEIVLEVGNRQRVVELLLDHRVDLALGGSPAPHRGLVVLAVRRNELVAVAATSTPSGEPGPVPSSRCPAGRSRAVSLEALSQATWLVRELGSGTRATADELFSELGIAPTLLTLGSNEAIAESVRVGLGVALISRDAVARQLVEGTLVEWRSGPLPLEKSWQLVARTDAPLPATAQLFVDHVLGPSDERDEAHAAGERDEAHAAGPSRPPSLAGSGFVAPGTLLSPVPPAVGAELGGR